MMMSLNALLGRAGQPQGQGAAQATGAPGQGSLFAMLLAQIGGGVVQAKGADVPQLNLPGDRATQAQTRAELEDALDGVAAWAAAQVDTVEPAAQMGALAERLGAVLARFDQAHGTNTVQVLAQNAASLPPVALPQAPAEAMQAAVAIARSLLGLDPAPVVSTVAAQTSAAPDLQPARVVQPEAAAPERAGQGAPQVTAQAVAQPGGQGLGQSLGQNAGQQGQSQGQPKALPDVAALTARAPDAPEAQPRPMPASFQEFLGLRAPEAPAQVSHPSAPAAPAPAPQPGGFAASLVGQIQGRQIGEGTTRIELAPRGLGGIEIDLAQDDLGALRVTIRAENPAVLHALRDNREALLAMLRDSGVSVDSGSLGFDDMARGEGQSHRSQGNGEAVIMSAELEGDDPAQPQAAPAADLGPGRVDMTT